MQDPSTAFLPIKPPFPEQEQLKCPRCQSSNTKFCYYNNYNLSQPRHFCKNCKRYWTKGGSLRNIPVGGSTRKGNKRNSSNSKHANPDHAPESTRTVPRRARDSPASSSSTPVAAPSAELPGNRHPGAGQDPTFMYGLEGRPERKILDMGGGRFGSLLPPSEQLGSIFEGVSADGSGFKMVPLSGFEDLKSNLSAGPGQAPGLDLGGGGSNKNNGGSGAGVDVGAGEGYLQSGDWGSSNGWPDLAIYTPGSSFQ